MLTLVKWRTYDVNQGMDTSGLQEAAKHKASEVVEQAEQVGDSIHDRVAKETDIRSTQAGEQVGALGEAMRGASEQLRSQGNDIPPALTEQVAVRAERLGRYLRETDGRQVLEDVQGFARQEPWLVAALGLAAGVVLARLLKASARGAGPAAPRALPPRSTATSYAGSGLGAPPPAPGGATRYRPEERP